MIVGHSSCVRVFSVFVRGFNSGEDPSTPFTVTLTCLRKVSLAFQPDFLVSLPATYIPKTELGILANVMKKRDGPPTIMACGADGSMGYIPGSSGDVLLLQSSPFAAPASSKGISIVSSCASKVFTLKQKGRLAFFHAGTGIKVLLCPPEVLIYLLI